MEGRMARLEAHILSTGGEQSNTTSNPPTLLPQSSYCEDTTSNTSSTGDSAEASQIVTLNLSCSLGAFPASSMINFTLTEPRGTLASGQSSNLLKLQLIPSEAAESLFSFYKQNMDAFAYDLLSETNSLASVSARSSLLIVAICTVAALYSGSPHYRILLDHLKNEVSAKVFSNNHDFDDVRALCIGSLWLNEISTALNSLGESPGATR